MIGLGASRMKHTAINNNNIGNIMEDNITKKL